MTKNPTEAPKIRRNRILVLVVSLAFLSGCMTTERVQNILEPLPQHFRANVGEIKVEPLNPLGLLLKGYVPVKKGEHPVYLLLLASNDTVLEEAFHSFELRTGEYDYPAWERFYLDFHAFDGKTYKDYGGVPLNILLMSVPFTDGLSRYVSHFEDTAWHFRGYLRGDREYKNMVVWEFVNGT